MHKKNQTYTELVQEYIRTINKIEKISKKTAKLCGRKYGGK